MGILSWFRERYKTLWCCLEVPAVLTQFEAFRSIKTNVLQSKMSQRRTPSSFDISSLSVVYPLCKRFPGTPTYVGLPAE